MNPLVYCIHEGNMYESRVFERENSSGIAAEKVPLS